MEGTMMGKEEFHAGPAPKPIERLYASLGTDLPVKKISRGLNQTLYHLHRYVKESSYADCLYTILPIGTPTGKHDTLHG